MKKVLGFIVALVAAFVLVLPSVKADGAITSEEQQILEALKQPVKVDGQTFTLPQSYLTQAENQLKQNNYSAAQVADVLAKINAVVKEVESADIKLPAGATFDDLVKALPASVKASIKANVEAAAKTLGLKVVITSAGITLVSGNNTAGNISTDSPVKQTGANYVASVVAAASLLVVAAGAFVVGKKAKLA